MDIGSDHLTGLAGSLGEQLLANRQWLCTAESCTGGGIAQVITAIAGSSGWFDRAYVTYSNRAKQQMLGVSSETLDRYGAVSEQTAEEMLLGALRASDTELAVAVTGIAGPGGGTPDKPVGTVCFGWGAKDDFRVATQLFSGDRAEVRTASVEFALKSLLSFIEP